MKKAVQTSQVEAVESLLLPCVECPGLTAIEESAKYTAWCTCSFVFYVRLELFQTLWCSLDMTSVALVILLLTSASRESELEIVGPRYVKLSTASSNSPLTVITGGWSVPCAITFVFFRLMVSPNSLQTWERQSTSCVQALLRVGH